ncbi:hypothetical protein HJFPF1_02161 [Paramyrothecium foliicola]|nr:hypothetical protein HJFPF1_02161 [Paramyrothecium foliicola]
MADPLSIAASIAGLLAAAGKIYDVLSLFISRTVTASTSVMSTLEIVGEMRLTLSAVQGIIESHESLSSSRKDLIQLDHLTMVITHSVVTISELEDLVCSENGLKRRLRWAWNEKKVLGLLPRLESQKSSLALMVAILSCRSDADAVNYQNRLLTKLDRVLQQNEFLMQRLQRLEKKMSLETRSAGIVNDPLPLTRHSSKTSIYTASAISLAARKRPKSAVSRVSARTRGGFELVLQDSRAYNRNESRDSDASFTTSTAPSNSWSMLSGMSLNDVSVISVYRLPLCLEYLSSSAVKTTFSELLVDQAINTADTVKSTLAGPVIMASETKLISNAAHRRTGENSDASGHQETIAGCPTSVLSDSRPRAFLERRSRGLKVFTPFFRVLTIGDTDALKVEMLQLV